jgi:hypothetical protein
MAETRQLVQSLAQVGDLIRVWEEAQADLLQ